MFIYITKINKKLINTKILNIYYINLTYVAQIKNI